MSQLNFQNLMWLNVSDHHLLNTTVHLYNQQDTNRDGKKQRKF